MAIVGYQYRVNGGAPVDVGDVLSYLVTGLDPDTSYTFEVRPYDEIGQFGPWSNVATAETFPALPSVFTADFNPASLSLANDDPISSIADDIGAVVATGTTTTRPLFKTNAINGKPAMFFDGTDDFLDAGDNFDLLNKSTTVFVLAKKTSSDFSMFAKCDGSTTGGYAGLGQASGTYGGCFYNSGGTGQNHADLTAADSDFSLYEFRFNRSLAYVEIWKDGVFQNRDSFTPDESTSRNVALNYLIGKFSSGLPLPFGGQIARLLQAFHNGKLPLSDVSGTYGHISSIYGTSIFNPTRIITCEGDSITEGIPGTLANSYPGQLATAIDANFFRVDTNLATRYYSGSVDKTRSLLVRNVGRSGATISNVTSDAADQVDNEFNSAITNDLVLLIGINDYGAMTDADIRTALATYCTDRKTANPDLNIYICNYPDASGYTSRVNANNTWLASNYLSFADHLIDVHSVLFDNTDTSLFADGLHPTTAGYTLFAGVVQTALGL